MEALDGVHLRPSHLTLAMFLGCLLATPPRGQTGMLTHGRVVDEAGDPVAHVTVTVAGDRPPLHLASTTPHVVTAVTDHEGRFRVGLRPGHEYCAWAVGEPALDGRRRVSALHDEVLPGATLTIPLVRQRSASRLRVRGLDRWGDLGPLSMRVAVAAPCLVIQPLPLGDEPSPLPPLPDGLPWVVFVDDGRGHLLVAAEVPSEPGDLTFFVPPPLPLRLRVLDREQQPVAGAVIRADVAGAAPRERRTAFVAASWAPEWREVGVTGADGSCTVRVPERRLAGSIQGDTPSLLVSRDGRGSVWRPAGPTLSGELELELIESKPWHGRLLDDGRALAQARVHLHAYQEVRTSNGAVGHPVVFATTTNAEGTFAFDTLPDHLVHPRLLVTEPGSPTTPRAAPAALLPPTLDEPWERDIGQMPLLMLDVADVAGQPCRYASVGLLPGPMSWSSLAHERFVARLDAGGKTTIPIDRGDWYVFVTDRVGFAAAAITVTESQLVSMKLEPLATMQGRLVLPARADARDSRFVINASRLAKAGIDRGSLGLRAIDAPLNHWLLQQPTLAHDGAFTLRFLAVDGARHQGTVTTPVGMVPFELLAGDTPVELSPAK